jgi:hypothetical protein
LANGSGKPSKGPGRFPPRPCISLSLILVLLSELERPHNSSAYSPPLRTSYTHGYWTKTFYVTRKDLHRISQTTKGLICYSLLHRKTQIHTDTERERTSPLRIRPSATAHWNTSECENAPPNTPDDGRRRIPRLRYNTPNCEFHEFCTIRPSATSRNVVQYDHLIIYEYYTIYEIAENIRILYDIRNRKIYEYYTIYEIAENIRIIYDIRNSW